LNFKQYITELKRRNIFKAAVAYLDITLPLLVFSTDKGIMGETVGEKHQQWHNLLRFIK